MEKNQANNIKKVIKSVGNYMVYFDGKKGELRVRVAQYNVNITEIETADLLEVRNICKILSALSDSGMRPKYRRDRKRYQGFLECRYIVFCW